MVNFLHVLTSFLILSIQITLSSSYILVHTSFTNSFDRMIDDNEDVCRSGTLRSSTYLWNIRDLPKNSESAGSGSS